MSTTLATHSLEPDLLSELALIADPYTSLARPFAEKFKAACEAEAAASFGLINPNKIRARLLNEPDYNPRQYAALWSSAFLVKTAELVQIAGPGSRGNHNKSVFYRRLAVTA